MKAELPDEVRNAFVSIFSVVEMPERLDDVLAAPRKCRLISSWLRPAFATGERVEHHGDKRMSDGHPYQAANPLGYPPRSGWPMGRS